MNGKIRIDVDTSRAWSALRELNNAIEAQRKAVEEAGRRLAELTFSACPVTQEEIGEGFDMEAHIERQREWSGRTFGTTPRAAGIVAHIRKELLEIEAAPHDLGEWIDVVILALDGAWRTGATPGDIIGALVAKQTANEARTWPPLSEQSEDKATEHDRSDEAPRIGRLQIGRRKGEAEHLELWESRNRLLEEIKRCKEAAAAIEAWPTPERYVVRETLLMLHEICGLSEAACKRAMKMDEGKTDESADYQADPLMNPSAYTQAEVDAACAAEVCPKCGDLLHRREPTAATLASPIRTRRTGPVGLRMYLLCGSDYVVATSIEDAWEQYLGEVGHVQGFGIDGAVVPDDSELTILVDEAGQPTDETGRKRKLTARAWAEMLGRGFAFSEEY